MAALNIYMRILLAGTGIYTLTNFKVRVDCVVVGIMSRCLNFTSSEANERAQAAIFDQSEARKVSTLTDSDAYNSQIMAQIFRYTQ